MYVFVSDGSHEILYLTKVSVRMHVRVCVVGNERERAGIRGSVVNVYEKATETSLNSILTKMNVKNENK